MIILIWAIDPGLRTAFSCLGTDGSIFEIGYDVSEKEPYIIYSMSLPSMNALYVP